MDRSEEDPSRWTASWGGSTKINFAVERDGSVKITWMHKSDDHPIYSGGQMITDALRRAKILRPGKISIVNITHRTTTTQLQNGIPTDKTALGTTLRNAADELDAKIEGWESEAAPYPWIRISLSYP